MSGGGVRRGRSPRGKAGGAGQPPPEPGQPRVSRQNNDLTMKRLVLGVLRESFLERFNLRLAPIVAVLPTELPVLEVRAQHTDLLFLLADGTILHLEFQTTVKDGDLGRFARYNLEVHLRHGHPVYTVVIYGRGITTAPDTLGGGSLSFQAHNIYLAEQNADTTLRALRRSPELTLADRLALILAPLMSSKHSIDTVAIAAARVAQRLPKPERDETVGAMVSLSYHYLEDEVVNRIVEVLLGMNLLDTILDQKIAEGEARGRLEEKRANVRAILVARFGTVPPALEERIANADLEALSGMFSRAAVAQSIGDMERA